MNMKITEKNNTLIVNRNGTSKIGKSGCKGTDPDSTLFYHIKNALNKKGFSLVKVRMSKDGHMFGNDNTVYLRSKTSNKGTHVMIYDSNYALRLAIDDYNKGEDVELTISRV